MEPFKWGMIGSVARAQAFSAETRYTCNPQSLHAFLPSVDVDINAQECLPGVTVCSNASDLLRSGVNAVYIASPHSLHYHQTMLCIGNSIPVLCERPLADSSWQVADLIRLSEHYNTFFMEALWIRFMPLVKKVLSIISSGLIGTVTSLRASVHYKAEEMVLPESSDVGGGALTELGTFPVFLSCLFLGQPSHIKATGKLARSGEDEDFSAFLSYDRGQHAFIEASILDEMDSFIDICGDKGNIYIKNPWNAKPEGLQVDLADGTKMVHKSGWQGIGLYFEMDEVQACIQKGLIESPFYSHEFNMEVSEVIDRIRIQLVV
jgi:scyllo-inositol 2-dehydrogenase (NADP+)